MTLDTYAHVTQTTLQAAADRMDDALGTEDSEEDDGAIRPRRSLSDWLAETR